VHSARTVEYTAIDFIAKNFDNLPLDTLNVFKKSSKQILQNIIDTGHFPNLLFFGPPGTGKTTTIINLIRSYQEKIGIKNKDLVIHLNASDERGIDIIRNQINNFVNSKPLFNNGVKFVILDEVDYTTKNAQQALRYLLQNYTSSVRFCLICNYISKIDEGLQNEFIKLRFNQLPQNEILYFLENISNQEQLFMSKKSLISIQELFKSDIRSMINFMQTNQDIIKIQKPEKEKTELTEKNILCVIDNKVWEDLTEQILQKKTHVALFNYISEISIKYNINKKNIIKNYINYIIRNKPQYVNEKFINFVEYIMHLDDSYNNQLYVYYSLSRFSLLLGCHANF
jgi:replication factor C subunit 3/5